MLVSMLCGCSLIFVTPPPDRPPREGTPPDAECTTSNAAPIIDTGVAGFELIRTVLAIGAEDSDYNDAPISRGADIALGLGFAALFGGSAAYGFDRTAACSDRAPQLGEKAADEADRRTYQVAMRSPRARPKKRVEAEPPTRIGGFVLGYDSEQARSACEGAGNDWTSVDAEHSECSGVVKSVGAPARAKIEFCGERLCKVTILTAPAPEQMSMTSAFKKSRRQLVERYGRASREELDLKAQCKSERSLEECLALPGVDAFSQWRFASGHQLLLALELASEASGERRVLLRLELEAPATREPEEEAEPDSETEPDDAGAAKQPAPKD